MAQSKASSTATIVARSRAAHQILDQDPKILVDPIAVGFVHDSSADELRANPAPFENSISRAVRASTLIRSRYAEDILEQLTASGVRQYVNLGAGLDTFAYRQPAWAHALTLYEVDHPEMQRWKQANLQRLGIVPPTNLRWCPTNFEEVGLQASLDAAGFDPTLPTCFAWLGVTPYLTEAAVDTVLRFVLSLPIGNSIVFSFVLSNSCRTDEERTIWEELVGAAASLGEPWLTTFEPLLLRDRLRTMGFSRIAHLSTEAANERYFAGRGDGLRLRHLEELMWATV
jgi:methyltransferase (TIGR00027 family)